LTAYNFFLPSLPPQTYSTCDIIVGLSDICCIRDSIPGDENNPPAPACPSNDPRDPAVPAPTPPVEPGQDKSKILFCLLFDELLPRPQLDCGDGCVRL